MDLAMIIAGAAIGIMVIGFFANLLGGEDGGGFGKLVIIILIIVAIVFTFMGKAAPGEYDPLDSANRPGLQPYIVVEPRR